jgi:hypothetical protein
MMTQTENNGLANFDKFIDGCSEFRKHLVEEDFNLIIEKIKSKKNADSISLIKIKNFLDDFANGAALANLNASSSIGQVMKRVESLPFKDEA